MGEDHERWAKRVEQIIYVRSQPFFSNAFTVLEPDPFETYSTRYWKFSMRRWTTALKKARNEHRDDESEVTPAAALRGA